MSRQHEGIVVVAYKPGQPASQVQADLQLADLGDFTTSVVNLETGDYGIAAVVNLQSEADDLVLDLTLEGFHHAVVKWPTQTLRGWRLV